MVLGLKKKESLRRDLNPRPIGLLRYLLNKLPYQGNALPPKPRRQYVLGMPINL